MGQPIAWKSKAVIELSEQQWSLIMGHTDLEKESARQYWRGLFPNKLPLLIPLRGRNSSTAPDIKEE